MTFKRMELEDWFDKYQFEFDYDIGESGVKFVTLEDLNLDLSKVELRYGHHKGALELREMIVSEYPGLSTSQVAVTNGASEAIFAVMASLLGPGDNAVIEVPNYPSLYDIPQSLERSITYYNLVFEEGFQFNLERLGSTINQNTKLICLSHPNNPTGSTILRKELEEVISFIESKGLFLLMDETYRELSFSEYLPLAASLSPRAISVSSMSKAFGVPGIRIGWVMGSEPLIDSVRAVREQITICNSAISEKIAFSILQQKSQFLEKAKEKVKENLDKVDKWINGRTDIEWVKPSGGVVGFPRLTEDKSTNDLCRSLIENYRTFTIPGSCFKMPRHFRLGFGGNWDHINQGLERLGKALDEWV